MLRDRSTPATATGPAEDITVITEAAAAAARGHLDDSALRTVARIDLLVPHPPGAGSVTARHFLDLGDTATVDTTALTLTRRAVADITGHRALGVVHGSAGLGKTFAVEHVLDGLDPQWTSCGLASRHDRAMRLIAQSSTWP